MNGIMNGGQRSFNSELVNKLFFHICTHPLHIQLIQSLIYLLVPKGSSSDQLFITGRLIRIDSHGKEFQRHLRRMGLLSFLPHPPHHRLIYRTTYAFLANKSRYANECHDDMAATRSATMISDQTEEQRATIGQASP